MRLVSIAAPQISKTLEYLQQAGREGKECVVLWLAASGDERLAVQDVYKPNQIAQADVFRIPAPSMRTLLDEICKRRLMIAAQIHSHPGPAFHSAADDAWAIVRHVGALSLVLPEFALQTTLDSFMGHMRLYQLDNTNRWLEVSKSGVDQCLHVC